MEQELLDGHLVKSSGNHRVRSAYRKLIVDWWSDKIIIYNLGMVIASIFPSSIAVSARGLEFFDIWDNVVLLLFAVNFLYMVAFSIDKLLYRFFNTQLSNSTRYAILGCICLLMLLIFIIVIVESNQV